MAFVDSYVEEVAVNKACPFKFDKPEGEDLCVGSFCMAWMRQSQCIANGYCGRVFSNMLISDGLDALCDELCIVESAASIIKEGLGDLAMAMPS
jgi:hypothetical protein